MSSTKGIAVVLTNLSRIFAILGSTLDLTANAITVGKHVERCDEARKYLVTNYN